jgi:hypothetical protein
MPEAPAKGQEDLLKCIDCFNAVLYDYRPNVDGTETRFGECVEPSSPFFRGMITEHDTCPMACRKA